MHRMLYGCTHMEAVGVKGLIRQQLVMYIHAVTRVTTMYTEDSAIREKKIVDQSHNTGYVSILKQLYTHRVWAWSGRLTGSWLSHPATKRVRNYQLSKLNNETLKTFLLLLWWSFRLQLTRYFWVIIHTTVQCIVSMQYQYLRTGFPLFHWKKSRSFPGLSRTPFGNFPGHFRSPWMLKYKEKTPFTHNIWSIVHCRNCSMQQNVESQRRQK